MKRFYRDILLQLLIFVCLIIVFFHLDLSTRQRYPAILNADFEPKVPVQQSSWLEQSILADLRLQRPYLSKEDVAYSVGINNRELQEHGFNVGLSKLLSYIRKLPDVRHELCRKLRYNGSEWPTASVIITFNNIPVSALLRTLHSVVKRSNPKLLRDIVLVDDGSTLPELQDKLEYYVRTRFTNPIKLNRNRESLGLAQARIVGARLAAGEVLIFMDAYCEPSVGWLEPLVKRIRESPTSVVMPVLDSIDGSYFIYKEQSVAIGGFSWNGLYHEHAISKRRIKQITQNCKQPMLTCPIPTPTMKLGSVYGIAREHFDDMSYFDETLVSSGGDTLEMSFSVWMCSGKIEILPCSRIGRLDLDASYKYLQKSDTTDRGNVAMGWWGKRNKLFFYYYPHLSAQMFDEAKVKRESVRDFLNCKNMDWFLDKVYPEKLVPSKMATIYGRIKSRYGDYCMSDQFFVDARPFHSLLTVRCSKKKVPSQLFFFTKQHQLRSEFHCMVTNQEGATPKLVHLVPCIDIDPTYKGSWKIHRNYISMVIGNTTLCLDQLNYNDNLLPVLMPCDHRRRSQHWSLGNSIATTTVRKPQTKTTTKKKGDQKKLKVKKSQKSKKNSLKNIKTVKLKKRTKSKMTKKPPTATTPSVATKTLKTTAVKKTTKQYVSRSLKILLLNQDTGVQKPSTIATTQTTTVRVPKTQKTASVEKMKLQKRMTKKTASVKKIKLQKHMKAPPRKKKGKPKTNVKKKIKGRINPKTKKTKKVNKKQPNKKKILKLTTLKTKNVK